MAVSSLAGISATIQLQIAGAPVSYNPVAGGPVLKIQAIVRQARRSINESGQSVTSSSPYARVNVADVTDPYRNDTITEADGTLWYVESADRMQSDLWMINLRREKLR